MTIPSQNANHLQSLIDVSKQATEPHEVEPGRIYVVQGPTGITTVDLAGDLYRDAPRRKRGTVKVRDAASFLAYWAKHADEGSEVYADRNGVAVVGVLDAHTDTPRFGDHRVVLQLRYSEPFSAWHDIHTRPMPQLAFAEFVEDHRADVREPAAADLLELAQTFQATTKATFKSGTVLQSGQRQLQYTEQIDASAGKNGSMAIPNALTLGLAIFEGATVADRVTARLRYRINSNGTLALIVILDNVHDIVSAAFEGVIADLSADGGVGVPILRGIPA